jgi:hypothetical protein
MRKERRSFSGRETKSGFCTHGKTNLPLWDDRLEEMLISNKSAGTRKMRVSSLVFPG